MTLVRDERTDSRAMRVSRRLFVGSVGSLLSLGTLGTLGYAARPPSKTLEVRVWFSDGAAQYDGVAERVLEYLGELLAYEYWQLDLSEGGVVSTSVEDGARVTKRGEWPSIIAAGAVGARDLEPAADVNLLVTDGQITTAPTGFAIPHVASVGGAQYLASLPSIDTLEATVRETEYPHKIVWNDRPTRAIQLLLHELGHALGLTHGDGVAFRDGNAIVATPMLSSYAWDPNYEDDQSRCGAHYATATGRDRKLSLTFSSCAQRELQNYDGNVTL